MVLPSIISLTLTPMEGLIMQQKKKSSVEFPGPRYERQEVDVTTDEIKLLYTLHELVCERNSLDSKFKELDSIRRSILSDRASEDTLLGTKFYSLHSRLKADYAHNRDYDSDCQELQDTVDHISDIFRGIQDKK